MNQLPGQVISGYRSHLLKRRVKEEDVADYLKWLRYFHDFCEKYRVVGDESHRVRSFLEKLREKKQAELQCRRAYNAVMLYFEMLRDRETPAEVSASSQAAEAANSDGVLAAATQQSVNLARRSFYSEAGYQEKSDSSEWDEVLAAMAAEIKVRHYSRKTLKTYANWTRQFQLFLKNKPPGELTTADVKEYLTHLAVKCRVAASTQKQEQYLKAEGRGLKAEGKLCEIIPS